MPFVKRELYHRGLKVPLLIKAPFLPKGTTDDQLVSFVDFGPSILSLAGIPIPKTMQGQAFLGAQKAKTKRKYIYAARDRMDSEYDRVRAVSDGRFNYLRNYMPEKPYYQDIKYRLMNPLMKHILTLKKEGKLNEDQMYWFRPNKVAEELYDTHSDPDEFINLAANPAYARKLAELRKKHEEWTKRYGDLGAINEVEMVKKWWAGQTEAPSTAVPEIRLKKGLVHISCQTEGASIGYRTDPKQAWNVYTEPFPAPSGKKIFVKAQRIGYQVANAEF
jgi:N-sulfoglucosamine sulfohydrolase